jgi:hypothetical protein
VLPPLPAGRPLSVEEQAIGRQQIAMNDRIEFQESTADLSCRMVNP